MNVKGLEDRDLVEALEQRLRRDGRVVDVAEPARAIRMGMVARGPA